MPANTISFQRQGAVATLTLNRPQQRNGMINRMVRELYECLLPLEADTDLRVLILTGAGDSFCVGADLNHYTSGAADEPLQDSWFDLARLLHELPQVTIAVVNGACAGAGFGMAAACDLRYAADTAVFNTAFLGVGASGDMGVPWTLSRILGGAAARELCLFPDKFDAQRALRLGLIQDCFPADELSAAVATRAAALTRRAPQALRSMKQNFVAAERLSFKDYLDLETMRHRQSTGSADAKEAFRAYIEKREPVFGKA